MTTLSLAVALSTSNIAISKLILSPRTSSNVWFSFVVFSHHVAPNFRPDV
ncbi:uncharacterized protein DEA37_0000589 [Paragonimus westermani]|uniref:Uncharacterized protein n=1 Tax=Paragonimus westermani TaxID=34504 RepID=A0A5J4NAB5_9TREM|nr:uncharacterized protein DEA37_0000589 [Paragonimus westermani]